MTVQIVWFKRDLRLVDHAPLAEAARAGPVLPLYVIEPERWAQPDASRRQWLFTRGALDDLSAGIESRGGALVVRVGDVVPVLDALRASLGGFTLWSHEETGNAWSYARDRAVKRWCRDHGVAWHERRQFGVVRGPGLDRDRWAAAWDRMMARAVTPEPDTIAWVRSVPTDAVPEPEALGLPDDGLVTLQPPGRAAARAMLASFLADRGEHYTRAMSSPLTAEHACSRLSPHLALGSLSMREAAQAAWAQQRALADAPRSAETARWGQAVRSFLARLHWHCHFIQKLESEPEAEVRPFARAYEGLRPQPGDPHRLAAFATGRTGYPFIDACLRALIATGWINFRMRAMLMSFASYDLWLPWQESGLVLARLFTDYEPGIHWPQCQMQSGETGINTVRVYSPVKQSQEQDPDGVFIRRWVPELARVPLAQLHTPWQLGPAERAALCPDYPERIVVHEAAVAEAKARLFAVRRQPEARSQANAVQRKHGSRKRTADRRRAGAAAARQASPQLALDLD